MTEYEIKARANFMNGDMKTVLALSSEVGVGAVGLSIARFAFAVNHISAICLPTVFFASRPDMGRVARLDISGESLAGQLEALSGDGRLAALDGVMTGYFASVEQVEVAAVRIEQLKAAKPGLIVLVDPVLGDHETGLYVSDEVAAAVRDRLVPLANVITPNQFELLWLAGAAALPDAPLPRWPDDVAALTARLAAKNVVVTSAKVRKAKADEVRGNPGAATEAAVRGSQGEISTVLVAGADIHVFTAPYFSDMPKGTGDVFAAFMLGRILCGDGMVRAAEKSAAYLAVIAEKARGEEAIEPFLLFYPNKIELA